MSATPEIDRLHERLFGDPARKTLHLNVWWGPEAASLTAEERAGVLNQAFDGPGEIIHDIDAAFGDEPG